MAKQIIFNYEGNSYTLEYTRRSIKQMEDEGFVAIEIEKKPMTTLPALFSGAFKAHHRFVKQNVIDEIYNNMSNKEELFEVLIDMFNEPIKSLMENPKDSSKNVEWKVSE